MKSKSPNYQLGGIPWLSLLAFAILVLGSLSSAGCAGGGSFDQLRPPPPPDAEAALEILRAGRTPHVVMIRGTGPEVEANNEAVGHYNRGAYHAAWRHFRRASEADSDNALVRANLAEALRRRALEAAPRGYARHPREMAMDNGDPIQSWFGDEGSDLLAEAWAEADRARKVDPALNYPHFVKAWILTEEGLKEGYHPESIPPLREAISLNPGYVPAYVALAANLRKHAYRALGSGVAAIDPPVLDEAEDVAEMALRLDPGREDARRVLDAIRSGDPPYFYRDIHTFRRIPGSSDRSILGEIFQLATGAALTFATQDPQFITALQNLPPVDREMALLEEQSHLSRRMLESSTAPEEATVDRIMGAIEEVAEPIRAESERRLAETEAENRRLLAQMQETARRREEAERRRREEARRRREADGRQERLQPSPNGGPTGGGVVIEPIREERREAELEERRRREEAARHQREAEQRRAAEAERRRQEEAARVPSWVDPTSPHPPCRGQGLDTFTESAVQAQCEMFRRNHQLVEGFRQNARTVTITVHSSCEVDHSNLQDGAVAVENMLLRLEGAITGTSYLTGTWFGTGLPSLDSGAGAISLPTSRRDTHRDNWLSPRWQQYRITFDTRRHGSGPPLTFEWSRYRTGPGLGESGTRTTRVVDGGVYDFQGRSTGALPGCFR